MKNQYVGDERDFGKYGLLRFLASSAGLRLGVNWYLTKNDKTVRDGRKTSYLDESNARGRVLRACDEPLWNALRRIVSGGRRTVGAIEAGGVLPAGTLYYGDVLVSGRGVPKSLRQEWCAGADRRLADSKLVFLDPDNGLAARSVKPSQKEASKYVYEKDIAAFARPGQSYCVFHYLGRQKPHMEQAAGLIARARAEFGRSSGHCVKYGSVLFLILPAPSHERKMAKAMKELRRSRWVAEDVFRIL